MHNFANEQNLAVHCKLPSRRWRIRRIRTAKDKALRKLEKEQNQIWDDIHNLGYDPVEPPIRCGYKRLFVITEDTRYGSKLDFYQGVLDKINNVRYSPTKEFEGKRTSKRWRRRKRKRKEQILLEPNEIQFHKQLKFTEDEKQLFYEIRYYDTLCKCSRIKYVFSEPWRFALRVKPHWITEIKRKDPLLEQRLDEVKRIINEHGNEGRLWKMRGGASKYIDKTYNTAQRIKRNVHSSLKDKPLYLVYEEFKEEKQWKQTIQ